MGDNFMLLTTNLLSWCTSCKDTNQLNCSKCGCEKLEVMMSTKMLAQKVGSPRMMMYQQLHEPVRVKNTARYSSEDTIFSVIIGLG